MGGSSIGGWRLIGQFGWHSLCLLFFLLFIVVSHCWCCVFHPILVVDHCVRITVYLHSHSNFWFRSVSLQLSPNQDIHMAKYINHNVDGYRELWAEEQRFTRLFSLFMSKQVLNAYNEYSIPKMVVLYPHINASCSECAMAGFIGRRETLCLASPQVASRRTITTPRDDREDE